ncbi:SCO family protein [Labrys monachus]|uniref:Protein SCO1/2 n=1 Tax=Labrys monachus TaxID=217067 RepID=A0ABU0FKI4_9HYPH|nr:SCO family protein [Labrys monachus]MDQ0395124.1 protein SCO1/2 [Labrys monachus]
MTVQANRLQVIAVTVLVGILCAIGVLLWQSMGSGGRGSPQTSLIGGEFTLVNQDGKPITQADFLGKPTAYFFGYTNCPDACPTTLTDMTDRLKALGPDGDKFNVVFITVDPARDTPQLLKTYLESFDPRITAATGTPAEIADVIKKFRVYAKKVGDGDNYTFDHSTAVYLMDARGELVTLIDYQEPRDEALAKMRRALTS